MAIVDENPLGLDGFAFVEFTGPDIGAMRTQLELLGFTATHSHPTRQIVRMRQGRIDLLVNGEPQGHAADFRRAHGSSACSMGFYVQDAPAALPLALQRGAQAAEVAGGVPIADASALQGIGGSILYLVERGRLFSDWTAIPGGEAAMAGNGVGLDLLDHLTHNVQRGRMRVWSGFYERVFGFAEQKFFDIHGQATGLFSQAMIAPDGAIRIPLNESQDDASQIEEYLRAYNGEGIQHLALTTADIHATVEALRARGVKLQDTLDAYYDLVEGRVPGHGEDLARLKHNRVLIDGAAGEEGLLLQIFTENLFGPIFFEIIQRKGNEGFGAGNFQALFESIELDQIRRGVVPAPKAA